MVSVQENRASTNVEPRTSTPNLVVRRLCRTCHGRTPWPRLDLSTLLGIQPLVPRRHDVTICFLGADVCMQAPAENGSTTATGLKERKLWSLDPWKTQTYINNDTNSVIFSR